MSAAASKVVRIDHVQTEVIERLTNLYGPPDRPDLRKFLQEYREAFLLTSPSLLREGVSRAIKANRFNMWPTIGEIASHVEAAGRWRASQNAREEAAKRSPDDWRKPPPEEAAAVQRMADQTIAFLKAADERERAGRNLPQPPPTDRVAWEQRQFDLIWEGKFCLSESLARRARSIDGTAR